MSINTNFNPSNGILVANNTVSQRAAYSSGIYGNGDGYFINKSATDTNILAMNRHAIDQARGTNNIYRVVGNRIVKTSFDGIEIASVTLNNPKSLYVWHADWIKGYDDELGCWVIDVDESNNVKLRNFDQDLNDTGFLATLNLSHAFGDKIHIVPSFSSTYTAAFSNFVIIYSKQGDESFWYIDNFIAIVGYPNCYPVFSYRGIFSENYCTDGTYSNCFPMDDKTPVLYVGDKLWVMTARVDGSTNFTREKILVFNSKNNFLGDLSNGLLYNIIDPLNDMFNSGANYNVMSDMDINNWVPNFILVTGGCENAAWVARYSKSGNFITKLDSDIGSTVDMPVAIKCVQNPASTFFYLLTENDPNYFPLVCDNSSSSSSSMKDSSSTSSKSTSSTSTQSFTSISISSVSISSDSNFNWTVSAIDHFIPMTMASSNTNGIIYIGGRTQFPHYGNQARLYKSTNQTIFTDITPYTEIASNAYTPDPYINPQTWIFEIKCNESGQYVVLGLGGVSRSAPYGVPLEVLFSNDYGSTWTVVVPFIPNYIAPNYSLAMTANLISISKDGKKIAIYSGQNSPDDTTTDYIYCNSNYGSGSWNKINLCSKYSPYVPYFSGLYPQNVVFVNNENDSIIALRTVWDRANSRFCPRILYSPDFGVSWENQGNVVPNVTTSEYTGRQISGFGALSQYSNTSTMIIGITNESHPYIYSYELWNIDYTIDSDSKVPTLISSSYPYGLGSQIVGDNIMADAYIVNPSVGMKRISRQNLTSWVLRTVSPGQIPNPSTVSGTSGDIFTVEKLCTSKYISTDNVGDIKCYIYSRG